MMGYGTSGHMAYLLLKTTVTDEKHRGGGNLQKGTLRVADFLLGRDVYDRFISL